MTTNDGSSTKDTKITNTTGLTQTGTNVRPSTNTFKTKTANNETKTTNNKTKTTNIKTTTERNIETKTEPTTETSTDQNKEHIICKVTKFFINIESLGKEIDSTFMMSLIAEPFNYTLVHIFKISIIPNQGNFINKNT